MKREVDPYMKKFRRRYQVTRDESKVYCLVGRFGKNGSTLGKEEFLAKIARYDPQTGLLAVWATGLSPSMAKKRLKKLRPVLIDVEEVSEACDDGFIGVFHEKDLDHVCEVVGVKKRQTWPAPRKQAAAARMRNVRNLRGKDTEDQRPPLP